MTNENILPTDGDIKPFDNHASGIEIKPLDNHASGGTPLTTQETPAADEEIQTLDNHASGPRP